VVYQIQHATHSNSGSQLSSECNGDRYAFIVACGSSSRSHGGHGFVEIFSKLIGIKYYFVSLESFKMKGFKAVAEPGFTFKGVKKNLMSEKKKQKNKK
jgi:hypothetical protein